MGLYSRSYAFLHEVFSNSIKFGCRDSDKSESESWTDLKVCPYWEGASGNGPVQVGAVPSYTGLDNGVP